MTDSTPALSLAAWLSTLRSAVGPGAAESPTPAEERLILEITRLAAHRSERIAAPISAYALGLSLAADDPPARPERLQKILAALEDAGG